MPFLTVQHLSKKFPNTPFHAVQDVSLHLEEGEIVALVGESGSGKSTLLRLIGGLEEPDEGQVFLMDKLVLPPSSVLVAGHSEIAMVFQDFKLLPKHRIEENLEYEFRFLPKDERAKRVMNLLELCGLRGIERKYPHELSGGQQQRVALAKALSKEPSLLLMDEPFSNLDIALKNSWREMMRHVETSILFVTHDAQEALSVSDRIAVMQAGKILQMDSPQEIYQNPSSPYVATLFGNANILPKEFLNVISFPFPTQASFVCIRFENIQIVQPSKQSHQAEIMEILYLGAYYQLKIQVQRQYILYLQTQQTHFQVGDTLHFCIEPSNVILFEGSNF